MNPALLPLLLAPAQPPVFSTLAPLELAEISATQGQDPLEFLDRERKPRWTKGRVVMQGFVGAAFYETIEQSGGSAADVDGADEDAAQAPVIGGGAIWKLGGTRVDFGLEAMFSFAWRANATAIAAGGGGAAIAVDVDMYLLEVFGGPTANLFLGDSARVYASAGPLLEWADYAQENSTEGIDDSGSGFGTGWYARTGVEFALSRGTMIGLGLRWSDSTIDLDGGLGDLDLSGFQAALTVTQGF